MRITSQTFHRLPALFFGTFLLKYISDSCFLNQNINLSNIQKKVRDRIVSAPLSIIISREIMYRLLAVWIFPCSPDFPHFYPKIKPRQYQKEILSCIFFLEKGKFFSKTLLFSKSLLELLKDAKNYILIRTQLRRKKHNFRRNFDSPKFFSYTLR